MKQGLPIIDRHKVVVLTITYNHSEYIEDTLKGFAMQQTNFPFLCCVFDDASTDGEQDVLKRWVYNHCKPDDVETYDHPLTIILKAPDKDNPNCIYVIHLQKVNTWGKPEKKELLDYWRQFGEYQALCEGDDYWIDPYKLQKQVEILENNSNVGLCYTSAKVYNQKKNKFTNIRSLEYKNFESLLINNPINTLTVLFRKSFLDSYYTNINPENKGWLMGDYPLWLWISSQSQIYFIKDITAVYRHLENSASHHTNLQKQELFNASIRDVRIFFQKLIMPNKNMENIFNNDFYRRNALSGIICNNRNYCYSNIKHVKNKNLKDKLKQILCFNNISFSILKIIILKKL